MELGGNGLLNRSNLVELPKMKGCLGNYGG